MKTAWLGWMVMLGGALGGCRDAEVPAPAGTSAGPRPSVRIGAEGGTVDAISGAHLAIPAGAVTSDVAFDFGFTRVGSSPTLPDGVVAVGPTYSLLPREIAFQVPVEVVIPFDPTQVPQALRPQLLLARGQPDAPWQRIEDAVSRDNALWGRTRYAGDFVVVVPLEALAAP
jgi:hypothetical protein